MSLGVFDPQWMDKALSLARLAADQGEVPVGAVIVKDGVCIADGFNLRETNHDPLAHAEIEAIRRATSRLKAWRLEGCELYVTLEPCVMCLGALQQARIAQVYYGARDPKMGAISLGFACHKDARTNHRFPAEFVETPEASQVLSDFFRALRKSE